MKLVKATVSIPDEVADKLEDIRILNLCNNIEEYVEEAIDDLKCVHWDKDLEVTFK